MKIISLAIMALMLFSIFAAGFAIAENEEVTNINEIATETGESDINEVLSETQTSDDDVKMIGLNAVTLANGWIIASDNTKAEITRALWTTKKQLKIDASKVKAIREQYKGNKAKIIEELKKLTSDVVIVSQGRLNIGTGKNMEKFKLAKKEITEDKASFYVLPINTEIPSDGNVGRLYVGSLELSKKQYTNLALWTGKLTLNSGTNKGEWNVNLASKTKLFRGLAAGKQVREEAGERAGEIKQKAEEKVKEAKKPLWKFWQRAKK